MHRTQTERRTCLSLSKTGKTRAKKHTISSELTLQLDDSPHIPPSHRTTHRKASLCIESVNDSSIITCKVERFVFLCPIRRTVNSEHYLGWGGFHDTANVETCLVVFRTDNVLLTWGKR